jgi:predicted lipoprotein with Yx(FWY)xxD motif
LFRLSLSLAAVVALAALSACGDDAEVTPAAAERPRPHTVAPTPKPARAERPPRPRGIRVRTVSSQFGRVVADRRGQAFYFFDKERGSKSECYGDCAKAWPPVLTKGRPVAGKGVSRRLLGTTRRRDGRRQLTYRGRPVYYYVSDAPGRILCQNVTEFGGRWLVIRPDGTPVE